MKGGYPMITNWTAYRARRVLCMRERVTVKRCDEGLKTFYEVDFPADVQKPGGIVDKIYFGSRDEAHQFAADMVAELVQAADIEKPMVTVIVYVRVNPTGEIEAEAFQTGSLAEANFLREKDRDWSWRRIYREVQLDYLPTKREERS